MTTNALMELAACPFCGSECEIRQHRADGFEIRCKGNACVTRKQRTKYQSLDWLREKMIEQWNTRAPATQLRTAAADGGYVPGEGEVLVTVSGLTGTGKSGVAGEIEILCKALGLQVEWKDSQPEKNLTHADWTEALELYKPRVTIIEQNIRRAPHGS